MSSKFSVDDGRLIFENGKDVGAVYEEVDGFYVVELDGAGAWNAWALHQIADLLDEMNQSWQAEVDRLVDDLGPEEIRDVVKRLNGDKF